MAKASESSLPSWPGSRPTIETTWYATLRARCARRSPSIAKSFSCRRRWDCRKHLRASSRVPARGPTISPASTSPFPPSPSQPDLPMLVAVTGASGFVGPHLVAAPSRRGWKVRLLLRRWSPLPSLAGVEAEVVWGDLNDTVALRRLVEGADAVVHAAGLIKARHPSGFMAVNRDGTARLAALAPH